MCALSQTLWQLIAARALQGVGGAGLMAMAQAAIADVVSPRERGRYQGYMASMWGLASVAGPIVGGYVTDNLSWRWIFWINLPLGLVAMALCDRALRLLPARGGRVQVDVPGALLLMAATTVVLLVLSWGGTEVPWLSAPIAGLLLLAAALGGALVWRERRAPDPVLPPRLFANATFTRGCAVAFCTSGAMLGVTFLLPLFYQLLHGRSAGGAGLLVMPFLVATVAGAFSGGQVARRVGRTKRIVLSGLAVSGAGLAGLALPFGVPVGVTMACSALAGLGLGATLPAVLMTVQNTAATRDLGAATGSLLFLRSMGGAVGTALAGALLVLGLGAGLQAAGLHGVDLGDVRDRLATLTGAERLGLVRSLADGFGWGFGACAALVGAGLAVAAGMRDEALRSGAPKP